MMLANRFDNLSVEDLISREKENYDERQAILAAIEKSMRAACRIKVDKIYTLIGGYLDGRRLYVSGLQFNASYFHRNEWRAPSGIYLAAWGYVERARQAKIGFRDGKFNYKSTTVPIERLDPDTESDQ